VQHSVNLVGSLKEKAALRTHLRSALFNSRLLARAQSRRHVIVLGDSHSEVLAEWAPAGWLFDVTVVGGATASGVRNPNSATEALPRYRERLARSKVWQPVMTMLGEVDCGYIIFRRARTEQITLDESLSETVRRYEEFIRDEVASEHPVIVMSAPLPTLPDDASSWGEIAQRRADVQISQAERTSMTIQFNQRISDICTREGWRFVDSTSAQLDPKTGLVRDDLIRHGSGDHHLADELYRTLLASALQCP
jgi:hypothetical protein